MKGNFRKLGIGAIFALSPIITGCAAGYNGVADSIPRALYVESVGPYSDVSSLSDKEKLFYNITTKIIEQRYPRNFASRVASECITNPELISRQKDTYVVKLNIAIDDVVCDLTKQGISELTLNNQEILRRGYETTKKIAPSELSNSYLFDDFLKFYGFLARPNLDGEERHIANALRADIIQRDLEAFSIFLDVQNQIRQDERLDKREFGVKNRGLRD